MRLLVIEDEKKVASFIKKGLEEEYYAVDVAYDGEQALYMTEVNEYDLIVLDIGSTCGGYTADESRTFALGSPTEVQQALFAATWETEEAVLALLRPGMPVADVYAAAQAVVEATLERGPGEEDPQGASRVHSRPHCTAAR